ncbi:MAG: DMT family transporter [Anaerolineae bacterium]|nr:DMT family transporter [Thermoflexales bacterium]MCX7939476.1 DMT family transporter [Thermoflexales bacterium]MDW8053208.1 DMT family transporter [Anaerolineae bacterium]
MRGPAGALTLIAALALGSAVVVTRLGFAALSPEAFAALRLLLAAAFFAPVVWARRAHLPRDRQRQLLLIALGVLNTAAPVIGVTLSLVFISSSVLSLIFTLMPVATGVIAHFTLQHEPLTRTKLLGLGVAAAGTGLLLLSGDTGLGEEPADWRGYAFGFGGMLAASLGAVIMRRYMQTVDTWVLAGGQHLAAALPAFAFGLAFGELNLHTLSALGWLQLLYVTAMNSVVSFIAILVLNQRFGATFSTIPSYLVPLVTAVLGAWLLGEVITVPMVLGGALIIAGVVMFNRAAA